MKIKYLKLRNFLSVGEEPVEIDFTKLGNIVCIKGKNLDAGGSNGSGKSVILDGIVYGLYGKLIKGLRHDQAINIYNKSGLEVEIHWDNYKVIRKRDPDRLKLLKDDIDISLSGIPATNKEIEKIIKFSYNSFLNVCCFGQHNVKPFLSCDKASKRLMAENLLSIDRYGDYQKKAKDKSKDNKGRISEFGNIYREHLQSLTRAQEKRKSVLSQQESWREKKKSDINILRNKFTTMVTQLAEEKSKLDISESVDDIDSEIEKSNKTLNSIYALLEKADKAIYQRKGQIQDRSISVSSMEREKSILNREIEESKTYILSGQSKIGEQCPACFGVIGDHSIESLKNHFGEIISNKENQIDLLNEKIINGSKEVKDLEDNLSRLEDGRRTLKEKYQKMQSDQVALSSRRKTASKTKDIKVLSLEKDVSFIEDKIVSLTEELTKDPYIDMISLIDKEIEECDKRSIQSRKKLEEVEYVQPYFDYWIKAFGDSGIRSLVLNEVVPVLNNRINYWLQFLIDGKIKITFDNDLEEKIDKVPMDSDPFVYNALSGGEHCRVDLAISQGFAGVTMLTSGICPSIVGLDEIGANLDRPGIVSMHKMIIELSRERQVLVITHDPDLLELLDGCDEIELTKKKFTTLTDIKIKNTN